MRASTKGIRAGVGVVGLGLGLLAARSISGWSAASSSPMQDEPRDAGSAYLDASSSAPAIDGGPRPDRPPNILLFTIDTLRADHLSSDGYARDTTPALDALARRGTRFDRAYSTSSWTLPGVASLLTGVLPSQHGVNHSRVTPDRIEQDSLSTELPSLAQMLHDAGYRTVGVTTNTHLLEQFGFGRGFDDYECTNFQNSVAARPAVWGRLDALRSSDTPYFLWVHITDPHLTYQAREPQFSRWWSPSRARHPVFERAIFLGGLRPVVTREGISMEEGFEYVSALYDSEIRASDDFLADLLHELDDGHLAIVVTSDHGEELNDHGQIGHGSTLFDEVVHVPLVIALPGETPSVVATPVSIVDVLPTLADAVGAPAPPTAGMSLLPTMRGREPSAERDIVMETSRVVPVQSIVRGWFHYGERTDEHPIERLFDLEHDPHEEHDCLSEHPDVGADLRQRLHAVLESAAAQRPSVSVDQLQLPQEIRDQLRALGYAD